MEKQQNCDSMTTVTVKDFNPQMDYQEPPPAYRPMKTTPMVQVAKIVAYAAVAIAGMLSFAIVFSAWLTNSSCQQQLQQLQQQQQHREAQHHHLQQQQQQPSFEALIQPESLKNLLALGSTAPASSLTKDGGSNERGNDLDSAESKTDNNNSKNDSSSEEDDDSGEDAVTMLKLPVELSFQEHMLNSNHRSHMNCIIEKKKAEEIVDEQSKPLPPLLGINMSTDPRYLHFTGEKMAISCDSGNDRHPPPPPPMPAGVHHHGIPIGMMEGLMAPPPPRHHHSGNHPLPMSFGSPSAGRDVGSAAAQTLASALAAASSSSVPIQIIGPIPLSSQSDSGSPLPMNHQSSSSNGPFGGLGLSAQMIPIIVSSSQGNALDDLPSLTGSQGNPSESIFLGPVVAPPQNSGFDHPPPPSQHHQPPPHFHFQPVHYQPQHPQHQHQPHVQPPPPPPQSTLDAQFPFLSSTSQGAPSHPFQFSPVGLGPHQPQPQSGEIRERAVPHPIPIMPRSHAQHVIRPRSVDAVEKKRIKRCSCDCACRNHQQ